MATQDKALDWPMSRDEKKFHVIRLYDQDVHAADHLLRSGETALDLLRQELQKIRSASLPSSANDTRQEVDELVGADSSSSMRLPVSDDQQSPVMSKVKDQRRLQRIDSRGSSIDSIKVCQDLGDKLDVNSIAPGDLDKNDAAMRLRMAIAEATEALGALLGAAALQQEQEDDFTRDTEFLPGRPRARSEGSRLAPAAGALRTSRERRRSRGGEPLKVSFVDEAYIMKSNASEDLSSDGDEIAWRTSNQSMHIGEPEPAPESLEQENRRLSSTSPGRLRSCSQALIMRVSPREARTCSSKHSNKSSSREEKWSGRYRSRDKDRGPCRTIGTTVTRRRSLLPIEDVRRGRQQEEVPPAPVTAMDFL